MAASLLLRRATSVVLKKVLKPCKVSLTRCSRRYLLSEAYSCNEAWKKRLEDPVFDQLPLSEFAIQLRDQYDKEELISAVDMEILANKLHEMDEEEAEFMEDLMIKFRMSPDANPVQDSIMYPVVRCYMELGLAERLLPLLQDRSITGLFPDPISFSLLLDHFIREKDFASAAQVAFELMLQEDVSHPTSRLLALYATVHHLEASSLEDLALPLFQGEVEGEEEDWVAVKYIRYPTYDQHFDLRCPQQLLGKTLCFLGRALPPGTLSTSLQVAGLALHHQFSTCLQLLEEVATSGPQQEEGGAVLQDCVELVGQCLEKVQLRDPERPGREVGLMTVEDEMYKLLPTVQERDGLLSQLQEVQGRLQGEGRVVQDKLTSLVSSLVTSQLPQHQDHDMQVQTANLQQWREERQTLLQQQMQQLQRRQKMEEIETSLRDLQEKEEMLRFFELYDQVRMLQPKKLAKVKKAGVGEGGEEEEEDEEVLRAKRIKRRKFRHNV